LIINAALTDYTELTGIDLMGNPFADKFKLSNSPEAILESLQERENAFKEFREGNRGLISRLTPAVKVLHTLSKTLGEALTLVNTILPYCVLFNVASSGSLPTS
jgi:hypothetical protein